MDEILNLIESVSEGFPSFFCFNNKEKHAYILKRKKNVKFIVICHGVIILLLLSLILLL